MVSMRAPIAMPFNPTSHRCRNKLKVEGAINIIAVFAPFKAVWIGRQDYWL